MAETKCAPRRSTRHQLEVEITDLREALEEIYDAVAEASFPTVSRGIGSALRVGNILAATGLVVTVVQP
jgi:hypothetical protein